MSLFAENPTSHDLAITHQWESHIYCKELGRVSYTTGINREFRTGMGIFEGMNSLFLALYFNPFRFRYLRRSGQRSGIRVSP